MDIKDCLIGRHVKVKHPATNGPLTNGTIAAFEQRPSDYDVLIKVDGFPYLVPYWCNELTSAD